MENLSINLGDYGFDQQGFGSGSAQEVAQLNKALSAGDITGRQTTDLYDASGAPLKVESLEKTLKHITFSEQDIRLWKDIPKKPAYNTVEEYAQMVSYGQDRGGFNLEGELPEEEDSVYVRRAQLVKYLGVTKSITHQMTLVNTIGGGIMQRTIKDGTLWILRKLTKALYHGNEDIVPLEFNGFLAQQQQSDSWSSYSDYMTSDNVVDCKGQALSEDAIQSGTNTIIENFGLATRLYAPPFVMSEFVKNFYGNKFIQPNTAALTDGVMGQRVRTFASQNGDIDLNSDVFFNKLPNKTLASEATTLKAAPVVVPDATTPLAVTADVTGSRFTAEDAGNVFYAVSSLNRYGESKLVLMNKENAAATIAANVGVDLKFTAGTGQNAATGFRIYRTKATTATDPTKVTFYPLYDVSLKNLQTGTEGAGANIIRDVNRFLPDCDQAMLVQFDTDVVEFAQLAPLMKMDLALLAPAYRFMILLYGTPFLYAPKKLVRIINIGRNK